MGTIVRGKIIRDDLALWDGKNSTSSRVDATGGSITGLQLNDFVDLLQVFGSGTSKTDGTAASAVQFVGTTTCTFMFSPGTWTFSSSVTFPSTVTCYIAAGAVISPASGKTVTFSGPVIHEATTWTGGAGTVTTTLGQAGLIDIADSGSKYTATTVEAAFAELAATTGAAIIGLLDSGGNFTATTVEAALAELASVATGNGASIIGVEDSAGNFTATDVEAALAELQTNIEAFYTTGSFTATLTGCATSPTDTWYWLKVGNMVDLWTSDNNSFFGTSNAVTMGMTGLPAAIYPNSNTQVVCRLQDNGNGKIGSVNIQTDGTFSFLVDDPLSANGFTSSGTKGFYGNISYSVLGAHP